MKRFAHLLEQLLFAPQRNAKLAWIEDWLKRCDAADRGWGVAALVGDLELGRAKAGLVRNLAQQVIDTDLFAESYDFVGDLAETTALIWPEKHGVNQREPSLHEVVTTLRQSTVTEAEDSLRQWLNSLDGTGRWALLKLITGGLRVGVSARMLRLALARTYAKPVEEIEEIWPLISPPYDELFTWLEGQAERPSAAGRAVFRPLMLAHPISDDETNTLSPADFLAEWKWDGARVQLASAEDGVRLFSRSGDNISSAFPELVGGIDWQGTLDGEILAGNPGKVEPFQHLQQRLNRKTASARMIREKPVFIRVYDLLLDGREDVRHLPIETRRARLQRIIPSLGHPLFDMSEELPFTSADDLKTWREQCRQGGLIEGLMLKRRQSPYQQGRVKGLWYKWKRDPLTADVVIMYAQRGHGKRSSFYSDFTFGAWTENDDGACLVPVGKAYSGFTDDELKRLDKFVRENTINRFGPVREVTPSLVVEVAFDSIGLSSRHKSGLAMRFPRFASIRWDKPAEEAETLEQLKTFLE